jgi:hypothetical protein
VQNLYNFLKSKLNVKTSSRRLKPDSCQTHQHKTDRLTSDSARPHRRRQHSLAGISSHHSRHRQNLIPFVSRHVKKLVQASVADIGYYIRSRSLWRIRLWSGWHPWCAMWCGDDAYGLGIVTLGYCCSWGLITETLDEIVVFVRLFFLIRGKAVVLTQCFDGPADLL